MGRKWPFIWCIAMKNVESFAAACKLSKAALLRSAMALPLLAALFCATPHVQAAQVQHLFSQNTTATGSGASGKPSIASFNIPAGKNRVLFIWAAFERDHCAPTDTCSTANTTGAGLGDNFPEPRSGTAPTTTSNNQITAQVTGPGGTINKLNALVVGGTPSGDLRFITISQNIQTNSTASFFSISNFHVALFENEIDQLLAGAASGTVSITLPDAVVGSNAGDDAALVASVFQNVEQTDIGMVRNATAIANSGTVPAPGNYSIAPTAYDAGQIPDEVDDGKFVIGTNATTEGFATPSGHSLVSNASTSNAGGVYDTANGNLTNEANGFSVGAFFRNGGATPGSLYSLTSAALSTTSVYGGTSASFLLESDNADTSDAPASYGNPTHTISGVRLGASVDADSALLGGVGATGDDLNGTDDENGVTVPARLAVGATTILPVDIQGGSGFLNVWFDWNGDGDFADSGEQVASNQAVATGVLNLSVAVPATASIVTTYARFRVCSTSGACSSPRNTAQSGEVEDYQVMLARRVILRKITLGGVGGPFNFSLTNTVQATGSITTVSSATAEQVDGDTGLTGTQAFTVTDSSAAVSINETSLPTGWTISGIACLNESGSAVGTRSGAAYTITAAEVAASRFFTCTYTNTKFARFTLTKLALGGGATFAFNVTGAITDSTFAPNPNPPSTPSVSKVYTDVTPGSNITITETTPSTPNWVLAAINCADAAGAQAGSTNTPTITNGSTTLGSLVVNLVAGADVTCTFINTRNVDIAIIKNSVGGNGTYNYTVTNSSGGTISSPAITTTAGSGLANTNVSVPNSGSVTFTITETLVSGFQLTAISCSASSGSLTTNSTNLAAGSVNLTATAGTEAACTYTNRRKPAITIRKQSVGGTGSFTFTGGTNGLPASLSLNTALGNPASGSAAVVTSTSVSAAITETVPTGWSLTGWACVDSLGVTQASGTTATMTVPSSVLAYGNDLTCTFTNSRQPRIRLQKALSGGRYAAADQFQLTIGPIGFIEASVTTAGVGATVTGIATLDPATVGVSYRLTETGAAGASLSNYTSTYSCTNALSGGQTPGGSGTFFDVVAAVGDDLLCTFTNARTSSADLRLTKTNTPGVNGEVDQPGDALTSGNNTTYSIVVSNAGPDAADGAVVKDPTPTGISCATASCTSSGGASCPVATGAALVTALQSSGGTAIPVFPANSSITIALQCGVP
jgi:uncharacterized repeat protein (TIGR01451 family)